MKSFTAATVFSFLAFFMSAQTAPIEARGSMSGDATYYDVGLGSCGDTNSNDEMVVALSSDLMGDSAGSSYCGKSITVKSKSGSVKVKVVDTCPGCSKEDVDLSPSAFEKIAKLSEGRVSVTWSI
ncbi:MAG: RlpA-like double-psi beta-barrel-protein domain-containing protein-containing protein [Benjaminiella poitrasii]|nr:MAG: RlpA-like double-psi beta-barrel-protein domain-containing protein-containing protein [Benjaminiella poitrasii]